MAITTIKHVDTISSDIITELRTQVATLKDALQAHFGSTGTDAHANVDATNAGFMSPELLALLNSIKAKLAQLKALISSNTLPIDSEIFWSRDISEAPDGFDVITYDTGRMLRVTSDEANKETLGGSETVAVASFVPYHVHGFWNAVTNENDGELPYSYTQMRNAGRNVTYWTRPGGDRHGSGRGNDGWETPLCITDTTSGVDGANCNDGTGYYNIRNPYNALYLLRKKMDFSTKGTVTASINTFLRNKSGRAWNALDTVTTGTDESAKEHCWTLAGTATSGWWRWVFPEAKTISAINIYNRYGDDEHDNLHSIVSIYDGPLKTTLLGTVTQTTSFGLNTVTFDTPLKLTEIYLEIKENLQTGDRTDHYAGIGEITLTEEA